MTAAKLELCGVAKRYGETAALEPTDLTVPAGAYAVVLGPSGSGKTTLLSILGGFTRPSAGRVRIAGSDVTDVAPRARPTITVFQDYALFPHMSVLDNVAFGLRMRGMRRGPRRERARAALDLVGLGAFAARKPDALSGGQRQRTALARAIVLEPSVLLLDEPLGALDQELRRQMQDELKALQRRVGATFVHVTHDQEEALALADLLVVMRAGRIEDRGPPERVYLRPATRFVAGFLGDAEVIAGRAGADGIETAFGTAPITAEAPVGAALDLVIRPEQLRLGTPVPPAWDLGTAVLGETVFLGGFRRGVLRFATGSELTVKLPPSGGPASGETLRVWVAPGDVVVLSR